MKHDDVQKLITDLQHLDVHLPVHQKKLRAALLTMHSSRRSISIQWLTILQWPLRRVRVVMASRKMMSVGVAIAVAAIVALGIFMLLPTSSSNSSKKLIAEGDSSTVTQSLQIDRAQTVGLCRVGDCRANTSVSNSRPIAAGSVHQNGPSAQVSASAVSTTTVAPAPKVQTTPPSSPSSASTTHSTGSSSSTQTNSNSVVISINSDSNVTVSVNIPGVTVSIGTNNKNKADKPTKEEKDEQKALKKH